MTPCAPKLRAELAEMLKLKPHHRVLWLEQAAQNSFGVYETLGIGKATTITVNAFGITVFGDTAAEVTDLWLQAARRVVHSHNSTELAEAIVLDPKDTLTSNEIAKACQRVLDFSHKQLALAAAQELKRALRKGIAA